VVVCPGVNDGPALESTFAGILDEYSELATVACVPLGLSRFSKEASMRPHTRAEAEEVVDLVEQWQSIAKSALGRRLYYAADEYYLMAGRDFPAVGAYDGFAQHENGIGMARAFEQSFWGDEDAARGTRPGFFAWVDGAPPAGYRARRAELSPHGRQGAQVAVITGEFGAAVLSPVLEAWRRTTSGASDVRLLPVRNEFFGGTIAVTGLLTGADVAATLARQPADQRYLLPDVCLSDGRFLDGMKLEELPLPVEVIGTDGLSLRAALEP
jgi:NifB/MoaA-like Fe-S oxidoreductase